MKKIRPWLGAALASILMNIIFFSLMPLMTNQDSDNYIQTTRLTDQVNIIRLKEPEPEIIEDKKKPEEKDPDQEVKDKKSLAQPKDKPQKVTDNFPTLDFAVNPNLPAASSAPVFPMAMVRFTPRQMDNIYTGAEIDNSLVPKVHMPPVYPFQAKRRGIEGWVRVSFLVNTQGDVEDISILESSPEEIFDGSVLNALPRWKFSPGTIQGVAVKTRVETTIRFELEN